MTTDNNATEPKPRFSDWLKEHRNGVLDVELAEAFEELVRAVNRTEKGGTIKLTLKVTSEGEMVAVNDTIAAAIPEKREARFEAELARVKATLDVDALIIAGSSA